MKGLLFSNQAKEFFSGGGCRFVGSREDFLREVAFFVVEGDDFLLDGVFGDETIDGYGLGLADAVCAVGSLVFDGWIPPWVEEDDKIGACEIEAESARLEADET